MELHKGAARMKRNFLNIRAVFIFFGESGCYVPSFHRAVSF